VGIRYSDAFTGLASQMDTEFADDGLMGLPKARAKVRSWKVTLDYTEPNHQL
jgi:hypothetical protein